MRDTFAGFYAPSKEDFDRLWESGLIVLDTNVLLSLYRLPHSAVEELMTALESFADRLWIPFHVALEFQRNRLGVIAGQRKSSEGALSATEELVSDLKNNVDGLEMDKRDLGLKSEAFMKPLAEAAEQLRAAIQKVHEAQPDVAASDPVRDRLDALLGNRIGPGPQTQEALDAILSDAAARFADNIPPGFADAEKEKNPNNSTFVHNGIRYEKKYGDLILWKQIINKAVAENVKDIILVTADRKEDWWWREQGKTIGPHPELVAEIKKIGSVDTFWMYSSVQFIQKANEYLKTNVSSESVAEVEKVLIDNENRGRLWDSASSDRREMITRERNSVFHMRARHEFIEDRVGQWLTARYGSAVQRERGFPDFVVCENALRHGYEIKVQRAGRPLLLNPHVTTAMLRGYHEISEGILSDFSLVIVSDGLEYPDMLENNELREIRSRAVFLIQKYRISSIIIGMIIDDRFDVLDIVRPHDQPVNALL